MQSTANLTTQVTAKNIFKVIPGHQNNAVRFRLYKNNQERLTKMAQSWIRDVVPYFSGEHININGGENKQYFEFQTAKVIVEKEAKIILVGWWLDKFGLRVSNQQVEVEYSFLQKTQVNNKINTPS